MNKYPNPQSAAAAAFPVGLCAAETVEITVPAGTNQRNFYFDPNDTLKNKRIVGAEVLVQSNSSRSPKSGNLVTTRAQMDNSYLTLSLGNGFQQFKHLWLPSMIRTENAGRILPLWIANVDWQDSFVYYAGQGGQAPATAFATNPYAFVFTFYTADLNDRTQGLL